MCFWRNEMTRVAKMLFGGSLAWVAVGVMVLTACPLLAADVTAPATTKPAPIIPTPDQAALIKQVQAEPTDEPAAKFDLNLADRKGVPNEHFGQMDQYFSNKHESFLKRDKAGPIGLLFVGDSITDFWGGRGAKVWAKEYGKFDPADFGVSGDRTEHVLWRIANGELDGISPKVVVLMIGTNNINSTADKIIAGDSKIVEQIHAKLPDTKLLLLGIFPRGVDPKKSKSVAAIRDKISTVNAAIARLDDGAKTRYLDIGDKFLTPDDVLTPEVMPDGLHPSARGYQIWADAMRPLLEEMMK
jgi:lysophospholipase L1-like esterase